MLINHNIKNLSLPELGWEKSQAKKGWKRKKKKNLNQSYLNVSCIFDKT